MKKIITLTLAALMCASLLGACAEKPAPAASSEAAPASSEAAPVSSEAAPVSSEAAPEAASTALPEKFILGLDASFPPMGFTDANNQIIGVDIDIAKAVCDKLGMEFEAKPIDWAAKDMELKSGKISAIWNGLTITDARKESYELSRPYMKNTQVIVVMNDSTIKAKADLAGKIVATQTDSSGETALLADPLCATIKDGVPKQYADYVTALGDLEFGRIDAIVMDSVVAEYYITMNAKEMTILEEDMGDEEYGIGFQKGNTALLTAVEGAMSELAAEGKIAEISKQWFGKEDAIITY